MAVAIFISLCGSYSGTVKPLARIYHVYCTILQRNSPFLALQLGSRDEAESQEAVAAAHIGPPSEVLHLVLEFLYVEVT